jgi:hypothetical protein
MKDVGSGLVFTHVPLDFVGHVWASVEPMFKPVTDASNGKYSVSDIYTGILDGTYVLWIVVDQDDSIVAAGTSRLVQYPAGRKAMSLDWIGGSRMSEWMPMVHSVMADYARASGCASLEGYGRKAWGKYMAKYGWEPDHIAYKMELNDGVE